MINPIHAIIETCYLLTVICIYKGQFPIFCGSITASLYLSSVVIKLSSYKIEYSRDGLYVHVWKIFVYFMRIDHSTDISGTKTTKG